MRIAPSFLRDDAVANVAGAFSFGITPSEIAHGRPETARAPAFVYLSYLHPLAHNTLLSVSNARNIYLLSRFTCQRITSPRELPFLPLPRPPVSPSMFEALRDTKVDDALEKAAFDVATDGYGRVISVFLCETETRRYAIAHTHKRSHTCTRERGARRAPAGGIRYMPIDLQWPKVWQNPTLISCRWPGARGQLSCRTKATGVYTPMPYIYTRLAYGSLRS